MYMIIINIIIIIIIIIIYSHLHTAGLSDAGHEMATPRRHCVVSASG